MDVELLILQALPSSLSSSRGWRTPSSLLAWMPPPRLSRISSSCCPEVGDGGWRGDPNLGLIWVKKTQGRWMFSLSLLSGNEMGNILAGETTHPWPLETLPKVLGQRALPVRFKRQLAAWSGSDRSSLPEILGTGSHLAPRLPTCTKLLNSSYIGCKDQNPRAGQRFGWILCWFFTPLLS